MQNIQNIKLTWPEAKEAMKEGRRVEHRHFVVVNGLRCEMVLFSTNKVITWKLGSEGKLGRKRVGL